MCGLLMKIGVTEKRRKTNNIDNLLSKIKQTETLHKRFVTPQTTLYLRQLRQELSLLLTSQFDFVVKRLQLKQYSLGNKPGAFLAKQLKTKATSCRIPYLKSSSGQRISNPLDIANRFAEYYSNLYHLKNATDTTTPDPTEIQTFLDSLKLPFLSSSDILSLGTPFSMEEISKVINGL